MIAISVPYWGDGPTWWKNFKGTIKLPEGHHELAKHDRRAQWRQQVNHELMKYGGRLQPAYMTRQDNSDMLVTFRIDSNYTMFVLKYS